MRQILFAILISFLAINIYGQAQFELKSKIGFQNVSVNGVDYKVDNVGIKISTNYPEFDTLNFKSDYKYPFESKTIVEQLMNIELKTEDR